MTDYKVSVIIPVYGVQNFIERCASSLFNQTMKEVEYIFVNDATPDKSIEILKKVILQYPERKVIVIDHSENKGLPAARNTGLKLATGKYIFHCDSDDYVEPDMSEQLYDRAVQKDADIVWCDWFLSFNKNERYMHQPEYDTSFEALKAMLSGVMKYNVWNKLVKRSLYVDNNIVFPDTYGMGEDMTMIMLFSVADNVTYLPKAYYHYVKTNASSFCQTYSCNHLKELNYNVLRIVEYLTNKYGLDLKTEIEFFKLETKFPFLISDSDKNYSLWKKWYPEANKFICQNKDISFRRRLLQFMAWKKQFWFVRLYYFLVVKIVYGFIYK